MNPSYSSIHPSTSMYSQIHCAMYFSMLKGWSCICIQSALATPVAAVCCIHLYLQIHSFIYIVYTSQPFHIENIGVLAPSNTPPPQGGDVYIRRVYTPLGRTQYMLTFCPFEAFARLSGLVLKANIDVVRTAFWCDTMPLTHAKHSYITHCMQCGH